MPHGEFVHLHLHTQYSLLDGACRIPELLTLAKQYKMDSLAITDHGNMFGAIEFYRLAQDAGIKPIIGCEAYIAPGSRLDKKSSGIDEASYHLILLAKDDEGYRNLMKLVSIGYLEGFYYRPRIDKEILASNSGGLIGMSACLKGEIPSFIQANQFNSALKAAYEYSQIFGKDNFYLELQENKIPEQTTVNKGLIKIAGQLNLPLVATNDTHYLTKDQVRAHEVLLCIQTQALLSDPNRMRFQTEEFYFRSPEEMKELFKEIPESIENTLKIAERCNLELDFKKMHLPQFKPPEGKTKEEYLVELCNDNLKNRYGEPVSGDIKDRLEHELKIIKDTGFTGYFLIVSDFINYAKKNGIPVGPGRGSAAGSIVSYLLGITDIDPLRYGLIFERFLNPQRIGLPDIDIDFCYERRPEVIEYVTNKYGKDNVAQIITFGTMQARAVIRDVGRVMGIPYADVDRIAKLIPYDPNITLKDAVNSEPELKSLYENDPQIKDLVDTALFLEGLNRHASIHAAGVVISDKPLTNYVPLFKTSDDQITTGFAMEALERIGLLKMDFLGLRTLTVISETIKLIKENRNLDVDINKIQIDDKKTFQLLCTAQTMGVFQVESSGMRDLLRKLCPDRFEDLIALLALYRPGPIGSGMLDDFIQRRHGKIPIKYDHRKLEPVLKETYGIIVYQEQVMLIASALAGFTFAQADLLRRAMSKKIPEVMEEQRKIFVQGCRKNEISEPTANKIFDLIDYFSGYGFNKSHSAAYALISYRTAYLKANFPIEFMTALLTSERDNTDKIVEYVSEASRMKINILPPDINESFVNFTIENADSVRFGLLAVKNVGRGAIESVVESRRKYGKFKSLDDLCQRVDLRLANKKVLESLMKCGACDSFGLNRSQMVAVLANVLESSSKLQREKNKGQLNFFDEKSSFIKAPVIPCIKEWPEQQLLAFEKEILGFYVSGNPLSRFAKQLKLINCSSTASLRKLHDGNDVKVAGLIAKIKHTVTRAKSEKMAILKLEDLDGFVEVLVFPKTFSQVSNSLGEGRVVMIKGKLSLKEETPKIIANDACSIEDVYSLVSAVNVDLSGVKDNLLSSLKERLALYPGTKPVYLKLDSASHSKIQIVVGKELYVQPQEALVSDIESLIGENRLSMVLN